MISSDDLVLTHNAIAALPIIGALATMPTRTNTLFTTLASVLPQVDSLYLFLDGFDDVPAEIRSEKKVRPILLRGQDNLHASSRFLAPRLFGSEAVICLFDDDILYPEGYTQRIAGALGKLRGNGLVGFHAAHYLPPHRRYVRDRQVITFRSALERPGRVHELGSGTLGFLSTRFSPDPAAWRYHDMDDIYVAAEANRARLSKVVLARPARWIRALAHNQNDSLWQATLKDDRRQSQLMRYVISQHLGRIETVETDWWTDDRPATAPRADRLHPVPRE